MEANKTLGRELLRERRELSATVSELKAIREVFGENSPPLSSSKSLCGHSLGAAGVQEAIHCLLMLENDFIAPSINVMFDRS